MVGPNISSTGIFITLPPFLAGRHNNCSVFLLKILVDIPVDFPSYLNMFAQSHGLSWRLFQLLESMQDRHQKKPGHCLEYHDQNDGESRDRKSTRLNYSHV